MFKAIIFFLVGIISLFPQKVETPEQLGEMFFEALKSNSEESLLQLFPSLSQLVIEMNRYGEEISYEEAEENPPYVYLKIKEDIASLIESAFINGVELSQLNLLSVKSIPHPNMDNVFALEINYSYGGKEGELSISTINIDGSWYLLEILKSYNVFKQFNAEDEE